MSSNLNFEGQDLARKNVRVAGYARGNVVNTVTATVARTDTSAKDLFILPPGAIITGVRVVSPAASDAGTTAVLKVGIKGGSATAIVNNLDVKTAATGAGQVNPNATIGGVALTSTTTYTGTYAETGTASTAGGPWTVIFEYLYP